MSSKPIRQPELTELATFVLAVEHASISAAAAQLRISPAAATKRLNNLEALAQGKLMSRSSRGVRPTSLGLRLLPAARQLLCDADALLTMPSQEPARPLEGLHRMLGTARQGGSEDELLTELELLLASVFRTSSEPLLIADPDGTLIDVNPAYCRLAGGDRDAWVGRNLAGSQPSPSVTYTTWPLQIGRSPIVLIRLSQRRRAGACVPHGGLGPIPPAG